MVVRCEHNFQCFTYGKEVMTKDVIYQVPARAGATQKLSQVTY